MTLRGRGSDEDGEGDGKSSATTQTRSTSKMSSSSSSSSSFLFEKRYDTFLRDGKYVRNAFNGTCLSGHILRTRYEQEIINGRYLRYMYLIRSLDGVAERMRLYDPPPLTGDSGNGHDNDDVDSKISPLPYEFPNLYFRAENQQRTLSPGEAAINGMFGDLIPPSPRGGGGGGGRRNICLPPCDVPHRR